jgi:hypothetical protein
MPSTCWVYFKRHLSTISKGRQGHRCRAKMSSAVSHLFVKHRRFPGTRPQRGDHWRHNPTLQRSLLILVTPLHHTAAVCPTASDRTQSCLLVSCRCDLRSLFPQIGLLDEYQMRRLFSTCRSHDYASGTPRCHTRWFGGG